MASGGIGEFDWSNKGGKIVNYVDLRLRRIRRSGRFWPRQRLEISDLGSKQEEIRRYGAKGIETWCL